MVEKDLADTREMRGKIAVVKGHYNTFFEKAQRVADAGASALILINWADGLGEFHSTCFNTCCLHSAMQRIPII